MKSFSYKEYCYIINWLQERYIIRKFWEITDKTESFCIIRHDVEFSIDRAVSLAKLESELGIQSTYFIQIRNNTYNAFSIDNIRKIRTISKLGHDIGLHVHTGLISDYNSIEDMINQDINSMRNTLQLNVNVFSYHRPTKELLMKKVNLDYINAYGEKFFHAYDSKIPKDLTVKYIADSNHTWKYGYPTTIGHPKLQINLHPFSWTSEGYENTLNFTKLIEEKNQEMINSMNSEIKTFPKDLL